MAPRRRERPELVEIEYSHHDGGSGRSGSASTADERGVRWPVVVVVTTAVLALGGLGINVVTQEPADTAGTSTSTVPGSPAPT